MTSQSFRSQRVTFAGGNGFELGGIVDKPEGTPRAHGLFSHCFTCNKDLKAIVRISRGLAAEGFLTLRYDMTGLGHSQGDFSQTNFSTNQRDLAAAGAFLGADFAPPTYLIGHSFGGACSLSMAQQIDSVQAVVSLASPSDTGHLAELLSRRDQDIALKGVGSVNIGGRDFVIRKQMIDDFRSHDLPATLRGLNKPALLLHSPDDETLGFEHVMRLYGLLTQSVGDAPPAAASLVCLPGADHLLINNPADIPFVTQIVASWLGRFAT